MRLFIYILQTFAFCVSFAKGDSFQRRFWKPLELAASDYLEFHEFHQVYIVYIGSSDTGTGALEEDINWALRIQRILGERAFTYTSVVPVCLYGDNLSYIGDSTYHFQSQEVNSSIFEFESHRAAFVARLHTKADAAGFDKILQDSREANWLLMASPIFPDILNDTYIPVDSKVTVVSEDEDSATFWQVYQVAPYLDQNVQLLGSWLRHEDEEFSPDESSPLSEAENGHPHDGHSQFEGNWKNLRYGKTNLTNENLLYQRTDLTGLYLKCTTTENRPYTFLNDSRNGAPVKVSGFLGDIFNYLQEVTNFTSNCYRVKDGNFGALKNDNVTWTGMVGEVHRGEADIVVANLDLTPQRSTAVDFLVGFAQNRYIAFMKRPTTGDDMWSGFTKEFERDVWITLMIFFVVFIVCSYCIFRFHGRGGDHFSDAAFIVTGFFLGQGTNHISSCYSQRILFFTVLMFHVILLAHYTSDLVSVLTAGAPPPRVSNLIDVNLDKQLQLGYEEGVSLHEYLKNSSVNEIREIWERNRDNNFRALTKTLADGFQRVLQGNYLFMKTEMAVHYAYGQDCRIYILPTTYFPGLYSFAISKGSPFRPILNNVLMRARATGLLDRWMRSAVPDVADCNALKTSAIELKLVSVAFLIIFLGVILSTLLLSIEILVSRRSLSTTTPSEESYIPEGS